MTGHDPRELHQHNAALNRNADTPTSTDPWAPATAGPETRAAHDRAMAELAARSDVPSTAGAQVLLIGDSRQLPAVAPTAQGATVDTCHVAVRDAADAAEAATETYLSFARDNTLTDTGAER